MQIFIKLSSLIIALFGGLTLIGWGTQNLILAQFDIRYIPMAPTTAIYFLLFGVILILQQKISQQSEINRIVGIIIIFSLLFLIANHLHTPYLTHSHFVLQGHMSPLTALNFFFLSLSLTTFPSPSPFIKQWGSIFSFLAFAVSFVVLTGYVYGTPVLYGGEFAPMAINTAIAFLLLSSAMHCSFGKEYWPLNFILQENLHSKLFRSFFPLLIFLFILGAISDILWLRESRSFNSSLIKAIIVILSLPLFSLFTVLVTKMVAVELERVQKALQASEKRYKAILSDQLDLISRFKTDFTIIFLNDVSERYTGVPPEKCIGLSVLNFIEDKENFIKSVKALTPNSPTFTSDQRGKTPNGKEYWITWVNRGLFDHKNQLIEIQGVGRDITEKILRERERKWVEAQLVHTAKINSLGTLSAGLAHEINNPLQVVNGSLELLKRELNREESGKNEQHNIFIYKQELALKKIEKIVHTLTELTESKPDTVENIDFHKIIHNTFLFYESTLLKEGITIKINLHADNHVIKGNLGKLQQVMMNIIVNAMESIQKREGEGNIQVETLNENDSFIVQIMDNGIGIPPAHLTHIFDPFFTTKDPGQGIGIGLTTVYTIIQNFDGAIAVSNRINQPGAIFSFTFPLALTIDDLIL